MAVTRQSINGRLLPWTAHVPYSLNPCEVRNYRSREALQAQRVPALWYGIVWSNRRRGAMRTRILTIILVGMTLGFLLALGVVALIRAGLEGDNPGLSIGFMVLVLLLGGVALHKKSCLHKKSRPSTQPSLHGSPSALLQSYNPHFYCGLSQLGLLHFGQTLDCDFHSTLR